MMKIIAEGLFVILASGASLGQEDRITILIEKCRSEGWEETAAGQRGLVSIGQEAVPYMIKVLKDKNEQKETMARMTYPLGEIGTTPERIASG